jgi:cytochrome P450
MIVSQAVAFFIAGFFSSSNLMTHMLHELALNPHMQEKVRTEIMEELEKMNGVLEYDSLRRLDYCNAVFKGRAGLSVNPIVGILL